MKKDRLRRIARAQFWNACVADLQRARKLAAKRAHDAEVKRAKRAAAKTTPEQVEVEVESKIEERTVA